MAPSKAPSSWEDEESESTPPSSPPVAAPVVRRSKFEDEEDDDVLDDWEEQEDSEVERERTKKAAEAKAKAEAEAKASHKSKTQRIEEKRAEVMRRKQAMELEETSDEEEDEADRRARLRAAEKESDLKVAEDMFGNIGINPNRSAAKPVTVTLPTAKPDEPAAAIDLSALPLFNPSTAPQFAKLRETLVPLLMQSAKKPAYALFLPEFCKQICKDLSSEQIKKVAAGLNTLSNEKMKEEKEKDKGAKKTKAAKTKTTLSAGRDVAKAADLTAYDDDGLDDGDFM